MACMFERNGIWQVKYYIEGKSIRRSLGTRNQRKAKKKVQEIEVDLGRGVHVERTTTSIKEFLEKYRKHLEVKKKFSPKSLKNDLSRLKHFFMFLEQKFPAIGVLESITPTVISDFLLYKMTTKNIKAKTANNYRSTLHVMFAYAFKHERFVARDPRFPNPVAAIDRYPEAHGVISYLEEDQVKEQLKILQGRSRMLAMVAMLIFAGLRRGELVWLTKKDVDLDKRLIYVRAKKVGREEWQPKTRRSNRAIPISNALYKYLVDYLPRKNSAWFFPASNGKRWNEDNFSRDLRNINKANDLEWKCLDFRHTFGTHLAQKGESLYKISRLMGNSPYICEIHYAHLIPERMRDTVEFGWEPDEPLLPEPTLPGGKIVSLAEYRRKRKADGTADAGHGGA